MKENTASAPDLVLSAGGISRVYPGGKGVFEVDLTLRPGELVGLMGPNGSGKSTLLRILATADAPTAGRISWFDRHDRRDPAVRRRLGILLDHPAHFEQMTGFQNAWFFARQYRLSREVAAARLQELFDWSGLSDARNQLVKAYSLGMKRKLGLIEALVHRPELLLLDEPSLALDYRSELDLIERLQLVSLTGTAVVLATNDVHLAQRICDRVLFLHQGRVIRDGHVASLLTELAGSKEVELQLHSPVPLDSVRALKAVEAASVQGDTLHVVLARGTNPAEVLAVLNGTADFVSTMRVRQPNLGDLFLKLTGVSLPVPSE